MEEEEEKHVFSRASLSCADLRDTRLLSDGSSIQVTDGRALDRSFSSQLQQNVARTSLEMLTADVLSD